VHSRIRVPFGDRMRDHGTDRPPEIAAIVNRHASSNQTDLCSVPPRKYANSYHYTTEVPDVHSLGKSSGAGGWLQSLFRLNRSAQARLASGDADANHE
jgi:hypothetical protein